MIRKRKSRTSKKPAPRDAPAAERPLAAAKRSLCGILKLWQTCGDPACRRAHDCCGDPEACFAAYWQTESEDGKVLFRELIKAVARGLGRREAVQAAEDELARFREWNARLDALEAAQAAQGALKPPVQKTPQAAAPMPRVRNV